MVDLGTILVGLSGFGKFVCIQEFCSVMAYNMQTFDDAA